MLREDLYRSPSDIEISVEVHSSALRVVEWRGIFSPEAVLGILQPRQLQVVSRPGKFKAGGTVSVDWYPHIHMYM